jgi:hypothetical protein
VKRSILSTLVLFFVVLGLAGPPELAIAFTPAAAEDGPVAEEREEQILRKSPSRKRETRGKRSHRAFLRLSMLRTAPPNPARADVRVVSDPRSSLSPGSFHLLQIRRI